MLEGRDRFLRVTFGEVQLREFAGILRRIILFHSHGLLEGRDGFVRFPGLRKDSPHAFIDSTVVRVPLFHFAIRIERLDKIPVRLESPVQGDIRRSILRPQRPELYSHAPRR